MSQRKTYLSKRNVFALIQQYSKSYPFEDVQAKTEDLLGSDNLTSRKNLPGHITASAIVFDRTLSRILLIRHESLDKSIQPGGHIEEDDVAFWRAALREFSEETGFDTALYIPFDTYDPDIPIDIDIHAIPQNIKRGEPAHKHYDFRYVFILQSDGVDNISRGENKGVTWKSAAKLQQTRSDLSHVVRKAYSLVSKKRDILFFEQAVGKLLPKKEKTNIVAVLHIVPDILPFISFLQSKFSKLRIIPKPNSISLEVIKKIPSGLLYKFGRKDIQNKNALRELFPPGIKSYIIDIGGYFAQESFVYFNKAKKRVLGIIEDTENGLQKYEKIIKKLSIPVVSIARSDLKRNEDELVGYSVAYYTEMVTRMSRQLPRYMTCGIIGYGKLGKGIARYLFNQNIKPLIYDKDSIRMVEAYKDGCSPVEKEKLLSRSQLIFSATGSVAMKNSDFLKLRPGAFVASVTSSEDEFDLTDLAKNFTVTSENKFLKRYDNGHTHWHLLNDGNAVNFIDKSGDRVGDFIRLVQGEILVALTLLMKKSFSPGQQEVSLEHRKNLAQLFLDYYVGTEDFIATI